MLLSEITFPNLGLSLNPSPIAFRIFGIDIYWYGVCIAVGFLLAVLYCFRRMKRFGIVYSDAIDCMIVGGPLGLVCARLYYVLLKADEYFGGERSIFDLRDGGIAIYGGILGVILGTWLVTRRKGHKLLPYADVAAMGLLIGQCVGRWGNFFNREAFGSFTDSLFAMRLPLTAVRGVEQDVLAELSRQTGEAGYPGFVQVHPTFLYESLWNLAGFVLIHFLSKKRSYDGQVFLLYLFWYGLGRVWIEGLRTDSLMLGPLRASQWLAGACILAAGGLLAYQLRKPHDPARLFVNSQKENGRKA